MDCDRDIFRYNEDYLNLFYLLLLCKLITSYYLKLFVLNSSLNGNNGEFTNGDDVAPENGWYFGAPTNIFSDATILLFGSPDHVLSIYFIRGFNGLSTGRGIRITLTGNVDYTFRENELGDLLLVWGAWVSGFDIEDWRPRFTAFLNGANGEATNSDDVSGAEKRKIKNKMLNVSTTPHKKKDGSLPKINKPCRDADKCTLDECRFQHPDTGVVKVEDLEHEEVEIEIRSLYEYEGKYYTWDREPKFVELKEDDVILAYPRLGFNLPYFISFGREFEAGAGSVNLHFYWDALRKLQVLPDETRNYAAVCSFVIKNYLEVMDNIATKDLIRYFIWQNISRAAPGNGLAVSREQRLSINIAALIYIPMTLSIEPDYLYNKSWSVLDSNGFGFDCRDDGSFLRKPRFNTSVLKTIGPKAMRGMFRFAPTIDMQTYASCGDNVTSALSRYFKERHPDEELFRQNQFNLILNLDRGIVSDMAELCDAEIEDYNDRTLLRPRSVYRSTGQRRWNRVYEIVPEVRDHTFLKVLEQFSSQKGFVGYFNDFVDYVKKGYTTMFNSVVEMVYTPAYNYLHYSTILPLFCTLPHPKRLIYTSYIQDEWSLQRILDNRGQFKSKFKWEFGKFNKVGRLYGTGEYLPLADILAVEMLKSMMQKRVLVGILPNGGNFYALFSDCQEERRSTEMFLMSKNLRKGDCMYVYYSDDGFFISNFERLEIFETDISSCDSSNGFPVFACIAFLAKQFGFYDRMLVLLAQCAFPTKVSNPSDPEEYVLLRPETFFEYSGSKLTTVLNNVASLAIAYGTFEMISRGETDMEACLTLGANSYGWVLDVKRKETFNAVTFLKRAYNGTRSWLTYGCMLRSLGVIDGELTPEKFGLSYAEYRKYTYSELTEILLKQAIKGLVNEPGSVVLNALRERAGLPVGPLEISITDINERYGTEDWEWSVLVNAIHSLKFGDMIRAPVLDKIFNIDYGVSLPPVCYGIARNQWEGVDSIY